VRELGAAATAGELVVHPVRAQVDSAELCDDGSLVPFCQMLWPTPYRDEVTTEANAALIAALCSESARNYIAEALELRERVRAEDAGLVEAMQNAANDCRDQEFFCSWAMARAALSAIARAEGGQ
jgi:hypothetical protein